jgi:glyoxylate/hydroxypyruvate reductase A
MIGGRWSRVALLFYSNEDDPEAWRQELRSRIPDLDFRLWPAVGDPQDIDVALVWLPPPGLLAGLPGLRVVLSLGAGIDSLLADPTLPDLPLCRMIDPSLTASMAEYALALVLRYHRDLEFYASQQRVGRWRFRLPRPAATRSVGVMGLGTLGSATATLLAGHGFRVRGWSRSRRALDGVASFAGRDELGTFLAETEILVCLLPLTVDTDGILGADLFARLPKGARLINLARGRHLVEPDLLDALTTGRLAHATLDVLSEEPLPAAHPFWRHPRITVTPHSASYSLAATGAEVVAENIRRVASGEPLLHRVDRARGY